MHIVYIIKLGAVGHGASGGQSKGGQSGTYVRWRACVFHRSIQSCGDQSANSLASLSISCLRVPLIVTSSS